MSAGRRGGNGRERGVEGRPPSHLRPRSREGRITLVLFLVLMALAQPPVVHGMVNRIEPWILGMPFLFAYLLLVYVALVGVLLWAMRKGL